MSLADLNRLAREARTFRDCMGLALWGVRRSVELADDPARRAALLWAASLRVRQALGCANALRDRKRAALCLKILNWLRADLARAAA